MPNTRPTLDTPETVSYMWTRPERKAPRTRAALRLHHEERARPRADRLRCPATAQAPIGFTDDGVRCPERPNDEGCDGESSCTRPTDHSPIARTTPSSKARRQRGRLRPQARAAGIPNESEAIHVGRDNLLLKRPASTTMCATSHRAVGPADPARQAGRREGDR